MEGKNFLGGYFLPVTNRIFGYSVDSVSLSLGSSGSGAADLYVHLSHSDFGLFLRTVSETYRIAVLSCLWTH